VTNIVHRLSQNPQVSCTRGACRILIKANSSYKHQETVLQLTLYKKVNNPRSPPLQDHHDRNEMDASDFLLCLIKDIGAYCYEDRCLLRLH
jgi:hypothetical protein